MARRKRLSPAAALTEALAPSPSAAPETKSARPPIASVVADAAAQSGLGEVAAEYAAARADGRLVTLIPLDAIVADHLVRDRMSADEAEMDTLISSIRDRGQQTPIEVEDLGDGTYGLISGWRRLEALKALRRETGDPAHGRIRALIRTLETVSDAYIAMVEENEIRANLSYYERARIAERAAERGVFPTAGIAVRELFRHASRAKRSKIHSFLKIHRDLGEVLRFPTALTERQGLALAKKLERDPKTAEVLAQALDMVQPETPEVEAAMLAEALHASKAIKSVPAKVMTTEEQLDCGLTLKVTPQGIEILGLEADAELAGRLKAWLNDTVTRRDWRRRK